MPIITIVTGLLLILVGVRSRMLSDSTSLTVYIPAVIGLLFIILGVLARRAAWRKHAMDGAAGLALLAVVGSVGGLMQLPALLAGHEVAHPVAVIARSLTAFICAIFIGLAVRSFIAARLARQAAQTRLADSSDALG